jgi:hypothetical protein
MELLNKISEVDRMDAIIQQTNRLFKNQHQQDNHIVLDPDLLLKLYELLQGEREVVYVYSKALQSKLCLVNPDIQDPAQLATDCPIYTTRELAYIISLSGEDFRRFHYLKTRLVG